MRNLAEHPITYEEIIDHLMVEKDVAEHEIECRGLIGNMEPCLLDAAIKIIKQAMDEKRQLPAGINP